MIVLLVDAHGDNTAGKCSPDHLHKEWLWSKNFTKLLEEKFAEKGIKTEYINPEDKDIPITVSAARCNKFAQKYGKQNCIMISPHNNAASGPGWKNASGFSVWVHNNASKASCLLAKCINKMAIEAGLGGNRSQPKEGFWRANFGILRETSMPAILTENLFMDNKEDLKKLHDEKIVNLLADIHVKAVEEYIANKWFL